MIPSQGNGSFAGRTRKVLKPDKVRNENDYIVISSAYLCTTRLNLISETRTAKFDIGTCLTSSIHVSSSNGCQATGTWPQYGVHKTT
jgi:hypothetical protein